MITKFTSLLALISTLFLSQAVRAEAPALSAEELALLGHRNFIVVADSAYPLQSHPSIETRYIGGDHLERIAEVVAMLRTAKHVNPIIRVDAELDHIDESAAPGIEAFRTGLAQVLEGAHVQTEPHLEIIKQLDESAELFRVLILKTDGILPYTSVFMELDCGYWDAERESALRESIEAAE
jgi:hypothetical protein